MKFLATHYRGFYDDQNFRVLYVGFISLLMLSCSGNFQNDSAGSVEKNPNGRNDAWGYVGYGGGGAMFHPKVSPHDPQTVLVACDMTGSFLTSNGGDSWRMFNLRGPVDYFVFDPNNPNIVYANSIALFRSADAGETWSLFYPPPPEVLGVISRGDHASEVVVTRDSTRRKVEAFAIDPEDSQKLFAAISIDGVGALYASVDGGAEWNNLGDLPESASNIFVDPSSPKEDRILYITGKTSVVAIKGGNWKINRGPNGVKSLNEFSGGFDTNSGKFILYAISGKSYFNAAGDPSGIYYSDDGGESWENRQEGILKYAAKGAGLPEWRSIATSMQNPSTVYVSYNDLQIHADTTCLGVARSDDYGRSWKLSWRDHLTPKGNIAAENYESGWINERFSPTWGENPFSLAVSPVDANICYGTDFGRTTKTEDGGKTWKQVYTMKKNDNGWVSRGLEVTTSYSVVFDPFDANHVFITNTDIGLMESNDGAGSWQSATLDNGVPRAWVNSTYWLEFDPDVSGRAWAAMSGTHDLPRPKMFRRNGTAGFKGGVVFTNDGGKNWTPVSSDIGEAAITHVLVDETSDKASRTIYACAFGKGVFKSVDGGTSWQAKNLGIMGDEPFAWRITKRKDDGVLFLIVNRRSEDGSIGTPGDGALYRSDNGAETWQPVSLPRGTNGPTSLMTDPEKPERLLLSAWGRRTEGKFSPDEGGGIFLSDDDGANWQQVLNRDQHIHDITYDARTKVFYACGFNGSAYRSTDFGHSWQRIAGYNFKWGKRVDADPRNPDKVFVITFGGGVWYGPATGDENAVEDITPALPYL